MRVPHTWLRGAVLSVVVLVALLLVGATSADSTRPGAASASASVAEGGCATRGPRAGDHVITVSTPDGPRTARIHLPRAAIGHPAPVLLAFHGRGGTGRFMEGYSNLTGPLNAAGVIGVFPDAAAGRWNLEDEGAPDDVAFVRALLDAVQRVRCVDHRRVWAVGVSNGGGFTARLACAMADRLTGVVVVAGGFGALPECHPSRPVRVMEIHGTADPVVPYGGDDRTQRRGAVLPWVRSWVQFDGCTGPPARSRIAARVVRLDWSGCRSAAAVSHIAIAGGRHQWPGATPPDPGPDSGISAARLTLAFLSGLSR